MIVRFSKSKDINEIINLWSEAFGDGEKEIKFFLDNKYIPENTLVLEENGKIASMLFLLEGKMHINNTEYPSYYLYAACTSKVFRGRGYMAYLLNEANRVAELRNKEFICLMPGERSLFDFYEKHGYKTVFNKKILRLNRKECDFTCVYEKQDETDLSELRNNIFSKFDFFKWDNLSVKFAFDHNELYSGKAILSRKGYCLYSEFDDVVTVKEFAFTEQNFEYGVGMILSHCDAQSIILNLPSHYEVNCGNYEVVSSAMIYPVNKNAEAITENLSDAYLGLTLD